MEKKEGKKSLQVQIFELEEEIKSLKATDDLLREAIEGNFKLIEKIMELTGMVE